MLIAVLAVVSQLHDMRGALNQAYAQQLLQRLQPAADGGLAGLQLLGRRLILLKGLLLTLTLLLCSLTGTFSTLLLSSLAIGLAATVAQDMIPAALATLAAAGGLAIRLSSR